MTLPPRYEPGRPLRLAGLRKVYSFAERHKIPQHWQAFAPYIGAVPGQIGDAAYGAVMDAGRSDGFAYMTAVEIADDAAPPEDFETLSIDAGRYAVFRHDGDVASLPKTMDAIHCEFLPAVKDRAVAGVIERYGESFNPATGEGGFDVLVPLKD